MRANKPLVLACLLATPFMVQAEPQKGDGVFTLSGAGSSDKDFDAGAFGLSFDYGKYFTDNATVGLRQSVNFADSGDDSSWNGATRVFSDYHFDLDTWQPFVGANIGGVYGDEVDDTFFAGPEAGLKYYVKPETFVFVQGEYQFFFDSADEAENTFDDGSFVYSAGIGFNF
ncbi:hypothetical protein QQM79_12960 [Marinobacteraceae bacterium S3BR75-40.1]